VRLPFLQVSQEEMARARTLAGYLGVSYPHALGMTVALKAAALEAAPEGDVSGTILDPNPAEWMAVQCGWPLDRADALASVLVRCGFVMAGSPGGHAVANMEPYARALDTHGKRSEAGRRGAQARKEKGGYGRAMAEPQHAHGQGMARDAKTQTQTHMQKKEEQPSAVASAPPASPEQASPPASPAAAEKPHVPPKPKKQPDSEHHALWRALETEYQRAMGHAYASGNGGQDAKAVQWLRETAKATPDEAVRRWGNLLRWSQGGFPSVTGFASLRQHWNAAEVTGATRDSRQATLLVTNPGRGGADAECGGCGTPQQGGAVGTLHLGYDCGCLAAWRASGVPYTEVEAWAREYRRGAA